jgi:hypothetical protein
MIKIETEKAIEVLKNLGIFDKIKQQGLVSIFLGVIVYIQYDAYSKLKTDFQNQNIKMEKRFETEIQTLKKDLLDCQNEYLRTLREQRNGMD